jgi:hypothetical protein
MRPKPNSAQPRSKRPPDRRRLRAIPRRLAVVCLLALSVGLLVASPALNSPADFPDVPASHPYRAGILDMASRGVIGGFTDGTFGPDKLVTRQQFAKMIVLTMDYDVPTGVTCLFADVDPTPNPVDPLYPAKYVAVCALHLVTTGYPDGTFRPADSITRQQLITMVVRAAGLPDPPASFEPTFTPVQFYPQVHYDNAVKADIAGLLDGLRGVGPAYDFMAPATRGECAQLLHNLIGMLGGSTTTGVGSTTTGGSTTTSGGSTTTGSSTTTTTDGSTSSSTTSSSSTSSSTTSPTTGSTLGNRSISGMVADRLGWASVWPAGVVQAYFVSGGGLAGTATISSDRAYTISGLPPGVYKLRTLCSNAYQDQWWKSWPGVVTVDGDPTGASATTVDVTAANATSKWFYLLGAHYISGGVRDPQGNPVPGLVQAWRNGRILERADINPDGTFLLRLPAEAGYKLLVGSPDHISRWYGGLPVESDRSGVTAAVIDLTDSSFTGIEMILDGWATVGGAVYDEAGTPVTNGQVLLFDLAGNLVGAALTNANVLWAGSYRIGPIFPGSYRVRTATNNLLDVWYGGLPFIEDPSGTSAAIVTVAGHEDRGVNFTLLVRRIIAGTVFREGGELVTEGLVLAYNSLGVQTGKTAIKPDGTYFFDDLMPGSYKICTANTEFVDCWYVGSPVAKDPSGIKATPIDVTSAHQRGVDLWLPSR